MTMGSTALADQCSWVYRDQAQRAVELLKKTGHVFGYCQPCGDSKETLALIETADVSMKTVQYGKVPSENMYQIIINGKGVDLAYLYDNTGFNLGLQVRCANTSPAKIF